MKQITYRPAIPTSNLIAAKRCYRVLSLSGGGYRVLFTAQLLAKIEAMEDFAGEPIGNRFDMIAGTSAGGLIAVALAYGIPARRVCEVLTKHGPRIFPRMLFKKVWKLIALRVYSSKPLEEAIRACVGDAVTTPFEDLPKSVMLTTVSWTGGQLVLLRSGKLTKISNPLVCSVLDAVCATSAAPAHFAAREMGGDYFVDGGLVANCPDLHALHEAKRFGLPVKMLSIGTAGATMHNLPSQLPLRGLAWAKPALDLSILAQESAAQGACRQELDSDYLHLNKRPGLDQWRIRDFDAANPDTTAALIGLAGERFEELLGNAPQRQALKRIVSPVALTP